MTDFEDQIRYRHFVAIATSKYDNSHTYRKLDGVDDEVELMLGWLTSEEKLGERRFSRVHEHLASNPSKRQISETLEDPQPDVRWGSAQRGRGLHHGSR